MSLFDIIILILSLYSFIKGYRKGLIFALFSYIAYILGIVISINFSSVLSSFLVNNSTNELLAIIIPLLSYAVTFGIVVFVVNTIAKSIKSVFKITPLGILDNILGGTFYLLTILLIASIIIWLCSSIGIYNESWLTESLSYPILYQIGPNLISLISGMLPFVSDGISELNSYFKNVNI